MNRTAILTFSRRTHRLTGPVKVPDGDTIVVPTSSSGCTVSTPPNWKRRFDGCGQQGVCGTNVVGRPRGSHSRGQGALRGGRAGSASSPRSSRPMGSTSAAGWCGRVGRWRTGGTRWTMSTPRTRPGRRGMWWGTFVKPWEWRASSSRAQASTPSALAGPRRQARERGFPIDWIGSGRDVGPAVPVGHMARTTSRLG
jgi:hypothetical protein